MVMLRYVTEDAEDTSILGEEVSSLRSSPRVIKLWCITFGMEVVSIAHQGTTVFLMLALGHRSVVD